MAKIDLKDAHFMIPIAQEDRIFLRFEWKNKNYHFNCLPFGLSSAPWVFTKTTKPIVAALRELGLCLIIYIDDIIILIMTDTESLLKEHCRTALYQLSHCPTNWEYQSSHTSHSHGFIVLQELASMSPRSQENLNYSIVAPTKEATEELEWW